MVQEWTARTKNANCTRLFRLVTDCIGEARRPIRILSLGTEAPELAMGLAANPACYVSLVASSPSSARAIRQRLHHPRVQVLEAPARRILQSAAAGSSKSVSDSCLPACASPFDVVVAMRWISASDAREGAASLALVHRAASLAWFVLEPMRKTEPSAGLGARLIQAFSGNDSEPKAPDRNHWKAVMSLSKVRDDCQVRRVGADGILLMKRRSD